jgi:hypothetical protein
MFILFETFIKFPGSSTIRSILTDYAVLLANFALLVGSILLIRFHGINVVKQAPGWYHSLVTLIMFFSMFLSGLFLPRLHSYLYDNVFTPLSISLISYVGWYIYSMLYRATRARTLEATVLIICIIFILLTNAPIGETIWSGIPRIGSWLSDVPGMGGWRGFIMGAALGMFALAIRAILGFERSYMGGGE